MTDADILVRLRGLNTRLRGEGDSARVRYVSVEENFGGLVLVVWELPDPPGNQAWNLKDLDRYHALAVERLSDLVPTVESLYRTSSEIENAATMGTEVPAAA